MKVNQYGGWDLRRRNSVEDENEDGGDDDDNGDDDDGDDDDGNGDNSDEHTRGFQLSHALESSMLLSSCRGRSLISPSRGL